VSARRVGDRVVARPMIPCRDCRFCSTGRESMCGRPVYVGVHRPGGFGELVALPARSVYPIPDAMPFAVASALAHSVPIGLHLVQTVGQVGPGDRVLVVGAAGGLGLVVAQLALMLGASVIAAARDVDRLAHLAGTCGFAAYGRPEELPGQVRALTDGFGATVAIDNVGDPALWPAIVGSMDKGGRILSAGSHAGSIMPLDLPQFYRLQLRLLATAGFSEAEFRAAIDLVARDEIRTIIHREYPLASIRDAFVDLAARRNVGKLVVDLG
jgi:threonine dehydrogenase-like Zn-dependent dehydrogenase